MRNGATLRNNLVARIVAFAWAPQGKASRVPAETRGRTRGETGSVIPTSDSINGVKRIPGAGPGRQSLPPALPSDSLQGVKSSLQKKRFYKLRAGRSDNETFSKVTGCVVRARPIRALL